MSIEDTLLCAMLRVQRGYLLQYCIVTVCLWGTIIVMIILKSFLKQFTFEIFQVE